MSVRFAGMLLRNPVIAASGTFGYGVEFEDIVSLDRIGGFVTKGLSREPMAGNQAPRLIETPAGMINAIGLQNIGVQRLHREKAAGTPPSSGTACIANVFGYEIRDYIAVIEVLNSAPGIAAYELNASCPNTQHGGMVFGTDTGILDQLVTRAKAVARRPLIVKLSPNVTSIAQMARCAEHAGADALSLVNTFLSLSIDVETRRPRIANITGGLSGPAIKPIAVRMVYEASRAVTIPIMRSGRHHHRRRRGRVPARRSNRRPDRNRQLRRPPSRAAHCRLPGEMVRPSPHRQGERSNRSRPGKRISRAYGEKKPHTLRLNNISRKDLQFFPPGKRKAPCFQGAFLNPKLKTSSHVTHQSFPQLLRNPILQHPRLGHRDLSDINRSGSSHRHQHPCHQRNQQTRNGRRLQTQHNGHLPQMQIHQRPMVQGLHAVNHRQAPAKRRQSKLCLIQSEPHRWSDAAVGAKGNAHTQPGAARNLGASQE